MFTHTVPFCGLPFWLVIVICVSITLGWQAFQMTAQHKLATRRLDRAEKRREVFYRAQAAERRTSRRPHRSGIISGTADDEMDVPARPVPQSRPRPERRGYVATPKDEEDGADEVAASLTAYYEQWDNEAQLDHGVIE